MERRFMNDIKRSDKSIRNIAKGDRKDKKRRKKHIPGEERQERAKRRSSFALWGAIGFIVLFLFFVFSVAFSGSKILAYPRMANISLSDTYDASRQAADGQLQYEVMTVTKEGGVEVDPTGESFVEERASGTITVYNDYSGEEQRLIANTRFQSQDGNIYRIREPIVVPGQRPSGDPGTVTAKVWAEEPGEEYNIAQKGERFTIPGLEGDPRFDTFWAQSDTAINGGFRGVTQTVSQEDKEQAIGEIESTLRDQVLQDTFSQVPQNYLLFEDGIFVDFESLSNQEAENGQVQVRRKAVVQAIIFNEDTFGSFFARKHVDGYEGAPVNIVNTDELEFAILDKEALENNLNTPFSFTISGDAQLVWQFDSADLASDFAGRTKADIDRVLMNYSSIERAEVILRPFWRRSFPDEASEITIRTIIE